jgi:hypothetical protein
MQDIKLARISQEMSERYGNRLNGWVHLTNHLRYEEVIGAKKHLILSLEG